MMINSRSRQVIGWIAVGCSTLVASVWAFWGIIENFHEGWYCKSLGQNLGLMFGQYLGFPLAFVARLCLLSPDLVGGFGLTC